MSLFKTNNISFVMKRFGERGIIKLFGVLLSYSLFPESLFLAFSIVD